MSGEERREPVPPGYKMTEVGVIPEEWGVFPVSECILERPAYGINAPAVAYSGEGPQYLRITDIDTEHRFNPDPPVGVAVEAIKLEYFLRPGDLVVARTGNSVGKTYRYDSRDGSLVFAGFLVRIRPRSDCLDPVFFSYCLQSERYWTWVRNTSSRSGQPGINAVEYATFRIAAPLPPEQRAIAEALSDVDNLLDALDRLIAKKRAVKQAVMQQLLTGKTRLPEFAGEWETTTLGEIGRVNMGQSPPSSAYNFEGRGIGLVQGNADIEDRSTAPKVFTENAPKTTSAGAIVMTVRAPVGKIAKSNSKICLGRGVCAIEPGTSFLYHALVAIEHTWDRLSSGSTFDSVNSDVIKRIPISWPSEAEQHAIADVLSDMDDEITALEKRRDKTRRIKEGMMQQLLTGRVRLVPAADPLSKD